MFGPEDYQQRMEYSIIIPPLREVDLRNTAIVKKQVKLKFKVQILLFTKNDIIQNESNFLSIIFLIFTFYTW